MSGETKFDPHKLDLGQLKTLRAASPDMYEALEELATLMDDVLSGSYQPDSFTTQPARNALRKARGESQ